VVVVGRVRGRRDSATWLRRNGTTESLSRRGGRGRVRCGRRVAMSRRRTLCLIADVAMFDWLRRRRGTRSTRGMRGSRAYRLTRTGDSRRGRRLRAFLVPTGTRYDNVRHGLFVRLLIDGLARGGASQRGSDRRAAALRVHGLRGRRGRRLRLRVRVRGGHARRRGGL
jgi:hypothetical protein